MSRGKRNHATQQKTAFSPKKTTCSHSRGSSPTFAVAFVTNDSGSACAVANDASTCGNDS